jgi:predicted chitinase
MFGASFPSRNSFYSYSGLTSAATAYSSFCGSGDTANKRRECAAAMANFHHETGGLVHVTEIAQGDYCNGSSPCGTCSVGNGRKYYGRGPIQLSWDFNYCAAGQALGAGGAWWSDPNQVQNSATIAWKTALWYWMTQKGPGYRPAHDSIINGYGFGETIRAINGALECGGGHPDQVQSRINQFTRILGIVGSSASGPNGC